MANKTANIYGNPSSFLLNSYFYVSEKGEYWIAPDTRTVEFDISSIPKNAEILSARLNYNDSYSYGPGKLEIIPSVEIDDNNNLKISEDDLSNGIISAKYILTPYTYDVDDTNYHYSRAQISNIYLYIEYTYGSKVYISKTGTLESYSLYHGENGELVQYSIYHGENGSAVKY